MAGVFPSFLTRPEDSAGNIAVMGEDVRGRGDRHTAQRPPLDTSERKELLGHVQRMGNI